MQIVIFPDNKEVIIIIITCYALKQKSQSTIRERGRKEREHQDKTRGHSLKLMKCCFSMNLRKFSSLIGWLTIEVLQGDMVESESVNVSMRSLVQVPSGCQYSMRLDWLVMTTQGLPEPSSRLGSTLVPEQLNIKAVSWACKLIDGCSLELCSATSSVALSSICHRNKVNSIAWNSPWDSISYIYIKWGSRYEARGGNCLLLNFLIDNDFTSCVASLNNKLIHISVNYHKLVLFSKNALKLSYSNAEFNKFSRENTWAPILWQGSLFLFSKNVLKLSHSNAEL